MTHPHFSFIIPVYNRPNEIQELLESFSKLHGDVRFEIVIVEDGSIQTSKEIVEAYKSRLNIQYLVKHNTGPGDSRNYGIRRAKGNYFIILDSDVILPEDYLIQVQSQLNHNYCDCFGGIDDAQTHFTPLQKAINFTMTAFITTGGIRGGQKGPKDYQPRSFNMGLSKVAFKASGGFGRIHPGEDPDLALRLKKLGFKTCLYNNVKVYHKRRISWSKFYTQVHKFGKVRPILNRWHPESKRFTYWLPTIFSVGFIGALIGLILGYHVLFTIYFVYLSLSFMLAFKTYRSIKVALLAVVTVMVQFFGYGFGFLKSTILLSIRDKSPEVLFPNLFFKS